MKASKTGAVMFQSEKRILGPDARDAFIKDRHCHSLIGISDGRRFLSWGIPPAKDPRSAGNANQAFGKRRKPILRLTRVAWKAPGRACVTKT